MLWYELKKIWHRWLVLLVLFGILLFHAGAILTNQLVAYQQKTADSYAAYEGKLTAEWNRSIQEQYAAYMSDPAHFKTVEELKQEGYREKQIEQMDLRGEENLRDEVRQSPAYQVLSEAYRASYFKEMAIQLRNQTMAFYAEDTPALKQEMVMDTFADLIAHRDQLSFNNHMGFTMLQESMVYLIRSFPLLAIVLLSTVFTNEQATGVLELSLVCRDVQRVKRTKFLAAVVSAGFAWGLILLEMILVTQLAIGFHGADGFMQDFVFNQSPYLLTALSYTLWMCAISCTAALVVCACIAMISSIVKKNSTAMILCFVLFLIPTFFNNAVDIRWIATLLYYHPSNYLSANYLLSSFQVSGFAGIYIHRPLVAALIMILLLIISYLVIRKREDRHYLMDLRNGDE